mmetsp:Transcript_25151/g.63853  ORF Transcript_25151/g.63853 Transcript_25151/m.63853 type:complete len:213 (+) Transcript_25151:449-1087(+)
MPLRGARGAELFAVAHARAAHQRGGSGFGTRSCAFASGRRGAHGALPKVRALPLRLRRVLRARLLRVRRAPLRLVPRRVRGRRARARFEMRRQARGARGLPRLARALRRGAAPAAGGAAGRAGRGAAGGRPGGAAARAGGGSGRRAAGAAATRPRGRRTGQRYRVTGGCSRVPASRGTSSVCASDLGPKPEAKLELSGPARQGTTSYLIIYR